MVFKRRDRRNWLRAIWEAIYPKGGWARAFHYVKHRVRRLPDSPERIARGIFAGVFTSFTPFFGLHFVVALILGRIINGNLFASVIATFFGNPLTFVLIAYSSLKTGYWLTGMNADADRVRHGLGGMFYGAGRDLWFNFKALFTHKAPEWAGLFEFYNDVVLSLFDRLAHSWDFHRFDLLLSFSARDPRLSKAPQQRCFESPACASEREGSGKECKESSGKKLDRSGLARASLYSAH